MPFAEQMLKEHGEFYPFAAAVDTAGQLAAHATYDGNEMPESEEVIASLVKVFQALAAAGKLHATGICYDGLIVQNGRCAHHQPGARQRQCQQDLCALHEKPFWQIPVRRAHGKPGRAEDICSAG